MAPLPPLETLRVFEVACRLGSYSAAARELRVTHSAVSQRIRQLEEDLGLTLFERQGNRMVPTSSGLRLQAGVKGAFSELGAALGSLQTGRAEAEITISLLPVMAARWLVPRLPRFKARFPRVNLHVKADQSLANFKSDGVDIAIRFGTGDWKGVRAIELLREECFSGL
jgi:LysR family glycine cleavage system transcriptional activator